MEWLENLTTWSIALLIKLLSAGELEARVGIEPTYKGFADLSLTTWVPRRIEWLVASGEWPVAAQ